MGLAQIWLKSDNPAIATTRPNFVIISSQFTIFLVRDYHAAQ
jgi:hypothetical protein